MHSRAVSLPDLVTEKRKNTTMSLSEGFRGFDRQPALGATAQGFNPYDGVGHDDLGARSALAKILPVYYRTRQFVLSTQKDGNRVPQKLSGDLKKQEILVASHIRAVNPLFFQRFDELQLDRLIRCMPFLRLSQGRWIFGGEGDAAWAPTMGESFFMVLAGRVGLYPEPSGAGTPDYVEAGAIFGEQRFYLGDESMRDHVYCSARCEEPCMIGLLTAQVMETAFADRAFGNRRIAQMVKNVPALTRVVHPEKKPGKQRVQEEADSKKPDLESGAILAGLRGLSTIATAVHVASGQEVLSADPIEENMLIVSKGRLEVRSNIFLTERLENLPPKRTRINIHVAKAEKLSDTSWFDKLDPYCIVKMGDYKKCQTPVMWDVGPNPVFDYDGVLTYEGEKYLEFIVMEHDRFSADDLLGTGSLNVADLPDKGFQGNVYLKRPKRGLHKADSTNEEEAGRVCVNITWQTEPITAGMRKPKEREFRDTVLFEIGDQGCWGHEHLMLGTLFKRTLEQASHGMKYSMRLGRPDEPPFRVVGGSPKGVSEICTAWKVSRRRFNEFIRQCSREKQFTQACRVSSLTKQAELKGLMERLIAKWETEEMSKKLRGGGEPEIKEEVMDPNHFRIAYRDTKCHVTVRNALNLTGGGMFDKLDPYAVVRFRGSKNRPFKTHTLEDAGSDPFWAVEGCRHKGAILYQGETAIEVSVWDYDKYSNDDLIAQGTIPVEEFCRGFEGCVTLNLPDGKKKKANAKQMMIVMGVQFDAPKEPINARTGEFGKSSTLRSAMAKVSNGTEQTWNPAQGQLAMANQTY